MDKLGYESGNTRQTGSDAETATIEGRPRIDFRVIGGFKTWRLSGPSCQERAVSFEFAWIDAIKAAGRNDSHPTRGDL
jgi:hypothetical protein